MFSAKSIIADHKDLVHDVSYDHYGHRFATCSSDHYVKVWDVDDDGQWYCSSNFKAHSGAVWRVCWAHPEFGQILATCSFDRTVAIWEEKLDSSPTPTKTQDSPSSSRTGQPSLPSPTTPSSTWIRRALLVDSRTSISDINFAPRHLGLLLATCSPDGTLRIYEAPDIMNLSQWNPQHDLNCKMSCSCLSWNPSPFSPPMIAVGSDDPPPPPNVLSRNPSLIGRSNSMSSVATTMTVASNVAFMGRIQIYESSENYRKWIRVEVIPIMDPVYDLAFGCNFGRDYHVLAVGSIDVKILALTDASLSPNMASSGNHQDDLRSTAHMSPSVTGSFFSQSQPQPSFDHFHRQQMVEESRQQSTPRYAVSTLAQFDDHNSKVWRVSWNLTGTILTSSGEDARIRLWKGE